jgi:hypothetical protein
MTIPMQLGKRKTGAHRMLADLYALYLSDRTYEDPITYVESSAMGWFCVEEAR